MKFSGLMIILIILIAAISCNRRTIHISDLSETEVGSFAAGELSRFQVDKKTHEPRNRK